MAQVASDDDKSFRAAAATIGSKRGLALSKLAEQKATNPAVKSFAEKMVDEHTKMTADMKPFADSWGGLTAPAGPNPDHEKELNKLTGFPARTLKVTEHTNALIAFASEAKNTKDRTSDQL